MNEKTDLTLTFELSHPPEKVWRALTEPKLLERWLMQTDFSSVVGEHFHFRREPIPGWDGVVHCEVLEVDEPRALAYTWRALAVDTVLRWTLEPTPEGTRLTLVQSGFDSSHRQAIGGAKSGWRYMAGEALSEVLAGLD